MQSEVQRKPGGRTEARRMLEDPGAGADEGLEVGARDPTARMRPPETAIASARGAASSIGDQGSPSRSSAFSAFHGGAEKLLLHSAGLTPVKDARQRWRDAVRSSLRCGRGWV